MSDSDEPAVAPVLGFMGSTAEFEELQSKLDSAGQNLAPVRIPRWGVADVVIALGGAIFLSIVLAIFSKIVNVDFTKGWPVVIAVAVPWLALAGWPVLVAKLKGNGARIDFGLTINSDVVRFGIIGGLCALLVGALAARISIHFFGPLSSTAGDIGSTLHGPVRIVFALLALVGAPICEELAFRGLVFGSFARLLGSPRISNLIAAIAFSLFHFEPKRFFILLAIGFMLGEVRIRSKRTSASIIAHMVNNTPAVAMLLFGLPHR